MAGSPIRRARREAREAGLPVPASLAPRPRTPKPFTGGNTAAVSHGAWSSRRVDPLAEKWIAAALESAPYLRDPSYEPALKSWARFEAKCDLIHTFLDEHGPFDEDGNPAPALKLLPVFEGRAANLRATLGMDPLSRAKLQKDTAATQVDLAALMAQEDL